jgi:membrane protease YdiL (CAAX protease family)
MNEPFNESPVARPIGGVPIEQVSAFPPLAIPVERSFPDVAIPSFAAAADLGIAVALILGWEGVLIISGLPKLFAEWWPGVGMLGTNLLIGLFNLAVVLTVLIVRHQRLATIGLSRPPAGRLLPATAIAIPACWAASIVGAVLYTALIGLDTTKMMAEKTELFDLVAEFPAVWILPFSLFVGIHEEVLFRGFFLSRMRAVSRSSAVAIIVTSLIFGLLHFYQGLLGIFQTTMIGLFLAIVVTYSRTLWPAIIAHAVFDATNLLIMPWVLRAVKESGVT